MIIPDFEKNTVYCDFYCKLCQCYRDKPCLVIGVTPMRYLKAELIACRRILRDGDFIGLWATAKVLEATGEGVPPLYELETCH